MGYIGNAPYSGLVTGDNILDGSVKAEDLAPGAAVPSQTGQSGKYLTTDGTNASWGTVSQVPSQTGQTGKYLTTDGTTASWGTVVTGVRVSGITYSGDDLATSPNGGQTVTLAGSGFASTPTVFVDGTIAPSVSFVSSSQITFVTPAKSAGTYHVYVVNPDGSTAIFVNGISYSGVPTWSTAAGSLGTFSETFSIQLTATGDAPITYTLTTGSSLPAGVTLSSSGLISGTVGTEQTFSFSVDATDAQNQETPRSFSVTIVISDAFFEYTTLLLAGSGATDSAFSDSSTSNHPITLNGDVANSTFSPYNTSWSNFFDGNGDGISFGSNANTNPSSSDITVEAWVYPLAYNSYGPIFSNDINGGFHFGRIASGFGVRHYGTGDVISYATTPTLNQWMHVAVSRSGNTWYLFYNGTQVATATASNTFTQGTACVGGNASTAGEAWNGYLSNVRFVKGTALYTSNFTPSTTPLTAVSNTQLLTCQSNRLRDASTNNFAITRNGDVAVRTFSPFTDTDTTTGSVYFDGTGDSLRVSSGITNQFTPGSAFTFEGWFYLSNSSASQVLFAVCGSSYDWSGSTGVLFQLYLVSGTLYWQSNGNGSAVSLSGASPSLNGWHHIAVGYNGTTTRVWVDGASFVSGTPGYHVPSYSNVLIGGDLNSANTYSGYMSNLRFVKGTDVYGASNTTITVPTSPLTAITNTSLLTCQKRGPARNSSFLDTGPHKHLITRNGNTTQGTFSPFSQTGWGNYFDGATATRLTMPSNTAFAFGTGAYTVEAWVYLSAHAATQTTVVDCGAATNSLNFSVLSTGALSLGVFGVGVTFSSAGGAVALNTWNHVAVVRESTASNATKLYVNGTAVATGTDAGNYTVTTTPSIGGLNSSGFTATGYISNVRLVKGTAVYTANFTPSTTPLTAITNTSLLTCQSNRFVDNSSNAFAITRNGDVSVQAFSPFNPTAAWSAATNGGSGYFDGSGDYLTVANSANYALGTSDFTIELWWYPTASFSNGLTLFSHGYVSYCPWLFYTNVSNGLLAYASSSGSSWDVLNAANFGTVTINAWNHIALCRSGSTFYLCLNGVVTSTATSSASLMSIASGLTIGATTSGIGVISSSYITNARIIKGTALYTGAYTLPTAPLTPVTNTQFLLSATNAGIYDATSKNNLETVGNAQISTTQSKFGGSSIYLDGTGDYLSAVDVPTLDLGSANFTIEAWVYITGSGSFQTLIAKGVGYNNQASYRINVDGGVWRYYLSGDGATWSIANNVSMGNSAGLNTWQHIALVRNGNTFTPYVNGVAGTTTTSSSALFNSNKPFTVGADDGASLLLQGYVQDVRVTYGYARYTANFTPPTAAFKLR
jgi:hypothetical protein